MFINYLYRVLYFNLIDLLLYLYSASFDSVYHKFLNTTLKKVGASNKSQSLFRTIYKVFSAIPEVPITDGTTVSSKLFQINREVVQGDTGPRVL